MLSLCDPHPLPKFVTTLDRISEIFVTWLPDAGSLQEEKRAIVWKLD